MEHLLGLFRIHVHRGVNLAVRDVSTSDPYVVIRKGKQKLKTRVVKNDVNPVWDEALTLSVLEPLPVKLEELQWTTYADLSVVDTVISEPHVIDRKQVEIKRTIPKGSSNSRDYKKKIFVGGIPSSVTEVIFILEWSI